MKLVIVSGLSGSGKTVALRALEDVGFYCMDNLHLGLLTEVVRRFRASKHLPYREMAVGIDARSGTEMLGTLGSILDEIRALQVDLHIIFLQAGEETLLRRFSETRRKHPLSRLDITLLEAVQKERALLDEMASRADLVMDTTRMNVHQLARIIRDRLGQELDKGMSLLFQSFGFKHGLPVDSDFVFDVRCLPNPHWEPRLQKLTGTDEQVIDFLRKHPSVEEMYDSLKDLLDIWLPRFARENRRYVTVSIGCTGGQHRSVYLVERLAGHFRQTYGNSVTTRHRQLP